MTHRLHLLLGLLLLVAWSGRAQAQNPADVRIVAIAATTEVARAASDVNSLTPRRLTKFVSSAERPATAVLDVRWQAPRAGVPADTVARLDYRRAGQPGLSLLEERLEAGASGERTTRFAIPLEPGGRVSSWRVRIVQGARVLSERTSSSWR